MPKNYESPQNSQEAKQGDRLTENVKRLAKLADELHADYGPSVASMTPEQHQEDRRIVETIRANYAEQSNELPKAVESIIATTINQQQLLAPLNGDCHCELSSEYDDYLNGIDVILDTHRERQVLEDGTEKPELWNTLGLDITITQSMPRLREKLFGFYRTHQVHRSEGDECYLAGSSVLRYYKGENPYSLKPSRSHLVHNVPRFTIAISKGMALDIASRANLDGPNITFDDGMPLTNEQQFMILYQINQQAYFNERYIKMAGKTLGKNAYRASKAVGGLAAITYSALCSLVPEGMEVPDYAKQLAKTDPTFQSFVDLMSQANDRELDSQAIEHYIEEYGQPHTVQQNAIDEMHNEIMERSYVLIAEGLSQEEAIAQARHEIDENEVYIRERRRCIGERAARAAEAQKRREMRADHKPRRTAERWGDTSRREPDSIEATPEDYAKLLARFGKKTSSAASKKKK